MDVMLKSLYDLVLGLDFFSCRIPLPLKLPGIFDYFVYFLKKIPCIQESTKITAVFYTHH